MLIIDANAVHKYLDRDEPLGVMVKTAVANGQIMLVTGGRHKVELLKTPFRELFREYVLSGLLQEFDEGVCAATTEECAANKSITSDDPHVLALGIVSGCRLLMSFDIALCSDFKNAKLLPRPRGKVIRRPNAALLREHSKR